MKKCPRCGLGNTIEKEYRGAKCISCKDCGYDEACELDMPPHERPTQREKARYSPYKKGGSSRAKR